MPNSDNFAFRTKTRCCRLSSAALQALVALGGVWFVASPVLAAEEPVHVLAQREGAAPRRDVSRVCPAIAEQLPEALASAWRQVGVAATVRVQFSLQGDQVSAVKTLSGPRRYQGWVRSAMADVTCRTDGDSIANFQFDLRFVDEFDLAAAGRSVALLPP